MRGPEPLDGWRVVAHPAAVDTLVQASAAATLRLAPDEVLVPGSAPPAQVADVDAIVVRDTGFVAWTLDRAELVSLAEHHVDWSVPSAGPAVAQGLVAGVPAKLWLQADGSARLVCLRAYAHELQARVP